MLSTPTSQLALASHLLDEGLNVALQLLPAPYHTSPQTHIKYKDAV
jgi:hypothetical protein